MYGRQPWGAGPGLRERFANSQSRKTYEATLRRETERRYKEDVKAGRIERKRNTDGDAIIYFGVLMGLLALVTWLVTLAVQALT